LQSARNEPCRVTLMAGMDVENTTIEAFYLASRLENPCKVHITETTEWLKSGVRLEYLQAFYEAVTNRQWR